MLSYSIRRLFQAGFVLIAMSFLVFIGVYAVGNPVDLLVNPQADEAERIRASISMGLDKPFYAQYFSFLGAAWSEGRLISLGYSFEQITKARRRPVMTPALPGEGIVVK